MNKIVRKLGVAFIVLATIVSVSGVVPANAQADIAALQAQIATLTAQLTALQAAAGTTTPTFNFTRNLTLGSTGDDVRALQQFLNARGHAVAQTGPGSAGNETTTFGPRTRDALIAFQTANQITPASGFFGPITRARIATITAPVVTPPVVTPPVVTPPVVTPPVVDAREGTIRAALLSTPVGAELRAGQTVSVAGFELEARDSAIRVQRLDVNLERVTGAETRPWRLFDRANLVVGGEVVATRAITSSADFTSVGNVHTLRFSGMNEVIPVGAKQNWVLQLLAKPVIEAANRGAWTATLPANAVRGVDGAGVNQTAPNAVLAARTFNIVADQTGEIRVTLNTNNPVERVVQVDDVNTTTDVELLAFDVRATRTDVTIQDMNVTLTATGTVAVATYTDNAELIAPIARLYRGNTLVGSANVPAVAGNGPSVVEFKDVNVLIQRDATANFRVEVELNRRDATTYNAGATIVATLTDMRAEDAGERIVTIPVLTSILGNAARLFEVAPQWTLVSQRITSTNIGSGTVREADAAIEVDITAIGGDIFINRDVGLLGAELGTVGDLTTTLDARSVTNDATHRFIVREGTTRRFTLTGRIIVVDPAVGITSGSNGMRIASVGWSTIEGEANAAPTNVSTFGLADFRTAQVTVSE